MFRLRRWRANGPRREVVTPALIASVRYAVSTKASSCAPSPWSPEDTSVPRDDGARSLASRRNRVAHLPAAVFSSRASSRFAASRSASIDGSGSARIRT